MHGLVNDSSVQFRYLKITIIFPGISNELFSENITFLLVSTSFTLLVLNYDNKLINNSFVFVNITIRRVSSI